MLILFKYQSVGTFGNCNWEKLAKLTQKVPDYNRWKSVYVPAKKNYPYIPISADNLNTVAFL